MSDTSTTRFCLRQLPLPAKLVISLFLLTVGLGYFSAMVQLHMRHSSRNGEPLPSAGDVVEIFSGLKKAPADGVPKPMSRIEFLVSGRTEGEMTKESMAPAFFGKSGAKYVKAIEARGKETVDAEREGDRQSMKAWVNADPEVRKNAYDFDSFALPPAFTGKPLTSDYFDKESKTLKIKTLIEERCLRCHGGDKPPELDEYVKLEKYLAVPKADEVLPGGWIRSSRQTSVDALTQSTHAHLLSFAMLFTLTGLIFSFTTYPTLVRGVLGPIVLLAQVADISCWWLARLDGVGPYFAMAILGTGGIVGLGLILQILLSLFNMYGSKGKLLVALVLFGGAAGMGLLALKVIEPQLQEEKATAQKLLAK